MTRLGLLLGGGGMVGVAWENGVLAGLADAIGFDAAASTVIVGTSAGAAVGADMALGKDPRAALDRDEEHAEFLGEIELPDLETGLFPKILGLMMSPESRTAEGAAKIGALAVQAETAFSEDKFVERFRTFAGTDDWPEGDFRPTCCNCRTGERKVWTAADGIELPRAVASSCAIPGFFPAISFEGEHYMDGSRGKNYHAAILEDVEVDAAMYIGPRIQAMDLEQFILDDMAAIEARGVRTLTVYGSERLDAANPNLMDATQRHMGFELGCADGKALASAVEALLS